MAYDKCDNCGHDWHGLSCDYAAETYNVDTKEIIFNDCNCKTSFGQGLDPAAE